MRRPPGPATIDITTDGTTWDTILQLHEGPSCPGSELLCDDDGGSGAASRINTSLSAGTYYVVVDEYSSYSYGSATDYILTVQAY